MVSENGSSYQRRPGRTITIRLEPGSTILFIGDSVTDCGRRDDTRGHLGLG